jgi:hypothetical protein
MEWCRRSNLVVDICWFRYIIYIPLRLLLRRIFNTKKANSLLRSLKVLGDVGAAIIVFGTFRQLAVDWGDFGKYFASALTVIILFLTACKTKNDI